MDKYEDLEKTPEFSSIDIDDELREKVRNATRLSDGPEQELTDSVKNNYIVPEKSTDELINNAMLMKAIDDLSRFAEEKGGISVTLGNSQLDISREKETPKIKLDGQEMSLEQLRELVAQSPQVQTLQKDFIEAIKEEERHQKISKRREDKIVEHSYRKDKLKGIESRINNRKEGLGTERLGEKVKYEESKLNDELQR